MSHKHLLIVYHSQSGRNADLSDLAAEAARTSEEPVVVKRLKDDEAGCRDLEWADAVIFFFPENFGALAGGMKAFFDRIFYPVIDKQISCSYAIFISTGNDGSQALTQVQRIFKGLPFREVNEPVIVRGEPNDEARTKASELGLAMAAGLAMGIF
ncbi:flavodoxin family protein [Spongiibacter sp. KMU-158]|uniref:Flavodoxin family protein n=1 Tax=Spongiibacter pelagi TaxID=2760804 RepID=A0A927GWK4_9GAMM|nr:NAD(P)H-dependent oxidoreductase [Spongiibacter pelagi]MBD2859037.1 flavodoxin family protein [Spongiibacter pelagi]